MKFQASAASCASPTRLAAILLASLWLPACGGGGGSSARVVPRIAAEDVTVAAPVRSGSLELAFLGDPPLPALAQIDLVYLPGRVQFGVPEAIVANTTVAGHTVTDGRYRLVFGDASNPDASPLQSGKLVRLPFSIAASVATGTDLTIVFENSRGATSEGAENSTESAPGVTTIRVR